MAVLFPAGRPRPAAPHHDRSPIPCMRGINNESKRWGWRKGWKRTLLIVSAGVALTAVLLFLLPGGKDFVPVQLRIVKQLEENGKRFVVVQAGVSDKRTVELSGIYLTRGTEEGPTVVGFFPLSSSPNQWRPARTSSGSAEGAFAGEKQFAIIAPTDWPVWRLHATAFAQLKDPVRNGREKVWMLWKSLKDSGVRPSAIRQILRSQFLGRAQVLISQPITNAAPEFQGN